MALARAYQVPLDDLVGRSPPGDPRVRAKPVRRHGRTLIPLTQRPGGLQAYKVVSRHERVHILARPRARADTHQEPHSQRECGGMRARQETVVGRPSAKPRQLLRTT